MPEATDAESLFKRTLAIDNPAMPWSEKIVCLESYAERLRKMGQDEEAKPFEVRANELVSTIV
jgi:hypothetical protein